MFNWVSWVELSCVAINTPLDLPVIVDIVEVVWRTLDSSYRWACWLHDVKRCVFIELNMWWICLKLFVIWITLPARLTFLFTGRRPSELIENNISFLTHRVSLLSAELNPLDSKGNYSATSDNTKLVHWPLMSELLTFSTASRAWMG